MKRNKLKVYKKRKHFNCTHPTCERSFLVKYKCTRCLRLYFCKLLFKPCTVDFKDLNLGKVNFIIYLLITFIDLRDLNLESITFFCLVFYNGCRMLYFIVSLSEVFYIVISDSMINLNKMPIWIML